MAMMHHEQPIRIAASLAFAVLETVDQIVRTVDSPRVHCFVVNVRTEPVGEGEMLQQPQLETSGFAPNYRGHLVVSALFNRLWMTPTFDWCRIARVLMKLRSTTNSSTPKALLTSSANE